MKIGENDYFHRINFMKISKISLCSISFQERLIKTFLSDARETSEALLLLLFDRVCINVTVLLLLLFDRVCTSDQFVYYIIFLYRGELKYTYVQ